MSKRPTSFAVSLRINNVKALLLIRAISNENLDTLANLINSVPTKTEKLSIINSINIQGKKGCETLVDGEALLKLAAENIGDGTARILLLVRTFINQASFENQLNIRPLA